MGKEKLNLVEILKLVPSGTEFYSTTHGECIFDRVDEDDVRYPIQIKTVSKEGFEGYDYLTSDGRNFIEFDGECVLFPSKENRSWEGWNYSHLKEGDRVMICDDDDNDWRLAKYIESNFVELCGIKCSAKYIVPAKDFDFENIESNTHKSVV